MHVGNNESSSSSLNSVSLLSVRIDSHFILTQSSSSRDVNVLSLSESSSSVLATAADSHDELSTVTLRSRSITCDLNQLRIIISEELKLWINASKHEWLRMLGPLAYD